MTEVPATKSYTVHRANSLKSLDDAIENGRTQGGTPEYIQGLIDARSLVAKSLPLECQ